MRLKVLIHYHSIKILCYPGTFDPLPKCLLRSLCQFLPFQQSMSIYFPSTLNQQQPLTLFLIFDSLIGKHGYFPGFKLCFKNMAPRSNNSCLENPMNGGTWWAAVHGIAKSRTRPSDFTFTFHFHALEKEMATHSSVLA